MRDLSQVGSRSKQNEFSFWWVELQAKQWIKWVQIIEIWQTDKTAGRLRQLRDVVTDEVMKQLVMISANCDHYMHQKYRPNLWWHKLLNTCDSWSVCLFHRAQRKHRCLRISHIAGVHCNLRIKTFISRPIVLILFINTASSRKLQLTVAVSFTMKTWCELSQPCLRRSPADGCASRTCESLLDGRCRTPNAAVSLRSKYTQYNA